VYRGSGSPRFSIRVISVRPTFFPSYFLPGFDDRNATRFGPHFAGDACKTGSTALKNQKGGSDAMRAA
jgi:hypothetical protein